MFPTSYGQRNRKLLQAAQRIAKRAGLDSKEVTLHDFRRTYATTCLRKGMDIPTVKKQTGALAPQVQRDLEVRGSAGGAASAAGKSRKCGHVVPRSRRMEQGSGQPYNTVPRIRQNRKPPVEMIGGYVLRLPSRAAIACLAISDLRSGANALALALPPWQSSAPAPLHPPAAQGFPPLRAAWPPSPQGRPRGPGCQRGPALF